MPRKTISFELDFMTKDILPRFTVKQFDDVLLNITPLMNNVPYTTTNMICVIYIGCDNDLFQQNTDIVVSSNSINIKLNKAMLQNYGRAYAELELKDSNGTVTSSTFLFNIEKKIGEGATMPGSIEGFVAKYERLIAEFKSQVKETINNCNTNVDNKLNTVDSLINVKISDFEKRFNRLTSSQQQDAEVIDARDGETSLKARLDRDIEKAKQIYVNVEGSHISTDSSVGYLKDVEILGNTIQDASNLADIRSVGDKVEGQELYEIDVLTVGKNLFDKSNVNVGYIINDSTGNLIADTANGNCSSDYIRIFADKKYSYNKRNSGGFGIYDLNKNFVKFSSLSNAGLTNHSFGVDGYIRLNVGKDVLDTFQFEEGTQATPYEPYQEDKLTILSPTPLEKVGDVADRIIEKDGVLGVEKNVGIFDDFLNCNLSLWSNQNTDTGVAFYIISDLHNQNVSTIISNKFLHDDPASNKNNFVGNSYRMYILRGRIPKDSLSSENTTGVKEYLHSIGAYVKYVVAQPTFIPLPHDQQIKLRTFANKTNISFGCEIEGTIKAQVPKSLGATVNTHTEQISNLNKELDRVKKLEESTVSTVETGSDFTTVEATSNGYFEDVKLEGKTLVNLYKCNGTMILNEVNLYAPLDSSYYDLSKNKTLTIINTTNRQFIIDIFNDTSWKRSIIVRNNDYYKIFAIEGDEYIKQIYGQQKDGWGVSQADKELLLNTLILLEGDHTQNPPSGYIEGLKSVGEDVDEIVVSSVKGDGNLFDGRLDAVTILTDGNNLGKLVEHDSVNSEYTSHIKPIPIQPNTTYEVGIDNSDLQALCMLYDNNMNPLCFEYSANGIKQFTTPNNAKYARVRYQIKYSDINNYNMYLVKIGDTSKDYMLHQSDKKRLLYYNEETQTWEKPILREWDSIEKHSNGKYYYHQRSAEVVLNGSESWSLSDTSLTDPNNTNSTISFQMIFNDILYNRVIDIKIICDKFGNDVASSASTLSEDREWIRPYSSTSGAIGIKILKTKLSTQDVAGFKQWLQANHVTIVYQLAQEKVYECTNIDLITYNGETNYVIESGVIVPKITLKVHNNISNVVNLLQKKVSLLESNMTKYMITQNRLMLASRYNADSVSFKVDVATLRNSFEYDNDLYELILNNILVGKDNYDREYIENLIIFYWMDFVISDEMYFTLFEIIEGQHDPKVIEDEEAPL